jgi:hypothetical protein
MIAARMWSLGGLVLLAIGIGSLGACHDKVVTSTRPASSASASSSALASASASARASASSSASANAALIIEPNPIPTHNGHQALAHEEINRANYKQELQRLEKEGDGDPVDAGPDAMTARSH